MVGAIVCIELAAVLSQSSLQAALWLHFDFRLARLQGYHALAALALERGQMQWALRPKHHLLAHLFLEDLPTLGYNPRFFHTFVDEDAIGRVMRIATRCGVQQLAKRVVERWLLGFTLRKLCKAS